jgi:hypothetical protein
MSADYRYVFITPSFELSAFRGYLPYPETGWFGTDSRSTTAPSGIVTIGMTVPVAPAATAAPDAFYYVTLVFELPPPPPGTWQSLTIIVPVPKVGGVAVPN